MPDDYTPPTDGDFEPSSDWLTYMSTSNYPWFTDWLAAHDAELREQIAKEWAEKLQLIANCGHAGWSHEMSYVGRDMALDIEQFIADIAARGKE